MSRLNASMRLSLFHESYRVLSICLVQQFRVLLVLTAFVILSACTQKTEFSDHKTKAISTNLHNYTKSEIFFAAYEDAANKFDITSAAPAGTTSFSGNPGENLGSGLIVHSDAGLCCFQWRYRENQEVFLKVVWLEIFDRETYRRANVKVDPRSLKGALAGSQWCESTVKVNKPFPSDPSAAVFHFLPDGSVEVGIAAAGKAEGRGPYSVQKLLSYPIRHDRPLCRNPIGNPWYLIPRKPYRE